MRSEKQLKFSDNKSPQKRRAMVLMHCYLNYPCKYRQMLILLRNNSINKISTSDTRDYACLTLNFSALYCDIAKILLFVVVHCDVTFLFAFYYTLMMAVQYQNQVNLSSSFIAQDASIIMVSFHHTFWKNYLKNNFLKCEISII